MSNQNDQTTKFLPMWVWAIALIQVFLVFFFSAGTVMNPSDFIPGVSEVDYVTQLYLTKNVTVALGIVIALVLRSHIALFTLLIIRVLTDISDVITVYALNVEAIKPSVPMVVVLLIILALLALSYCWKKINHESK